MSSSIPPANRHVPTQHRPAGSSGAPPGEAARPVRVLIVMPWFYPAFIYGGPVHSVYDLARALARQGCSVRVLTTDANGRESLDVNCGHDTQMDDGVIVRYCRRWFGDSVSPLLVRRLAGEIKNADVVYIGLTYSFPVIPALALCKWYGKPVVWSPRGALQRYADTRRRHMKRAWEAVCAAVAPSRTVLHVTSDEEASESATRVARPCVVIPNAVAVPDRINRDDAGGLLRMLFIGRLHPKKGIDKLLDACALLPSSLDWCLTIVGSGDPRYTIDLRSRIEQLRLQARVHMLGLLAGEEKKRAFERCDLAVFPSQTENFGMVVAEALAHGVPVIASKGTPWRRVQEVGCGMWVENDPRTIANAIVKMSTQPLAEMGARGRAWVRREFSWDDSAGRMLTVFNDLIANAPMRPLPSKASEDVLA
jgi:glycosyltransferase involved in cell wall biosynthesis